LQVNQLVSSLAINLTAAGLTTYGARLLLNSTVKLPGIDPIAIPILKDVPFMGVFFNQDPLFYLLIFFVSLGTYVLFHTHWGLALRAVGNMPIAATTEALQLRIQAFNLQIPYQLLATLPYAIAPFALVGIAGKATPPAALGVPYSKENL
jgi:ABC-type uncharacterized transport system permease subunit